MNKSRDLVFFYPEPRTQQWGHVRGFSGGSCGWYVKSQHRSETASTVFSTRHPVSRPSDSWCPESWVCRSMIARQKVIHLIVRLSVTVNDCQTTRHPPYRSSPESRGVCRWTAVPTTRHPPYRSSPESRGVCRWTAVPTTRHLPHRRVQRPECVSERFSDNKASASSLCPETGVCSWELLLDNINGATRRTVLR